MTSPTLAFGMPTGPDMMILAILVLVLFGAKKLPVFSRSLGRSMSEFRRAKEEFEKELRDGTDDEPLRDEALQKDPHAGVNRVISMVFLFSLLVLIISILHQVMIR